MQERMQAVNDHILGLQEEAAARRLAADGHPAARRGGILGALRGRMGRSMMALGSLIAGPAAECESGPDGMAAARM